MEGVTVGGSHLRPSEGRCLPNNEEPSGAAASATEKTTLPTRRRFLGAAASVLAVPAFVRGDKERPLVAQGVASGDVAGDSAVVWSRCDRPARMLVEWSTTEAFRDSHRLAGPTALP